MSSKYRFEFTKDNIRLYKFRISQFPLSSAALFPTAMPLHSP